MVVNTEEVKEGMSLMVEGHSEKSRKERLWAPEMEDTIGKIGKVTSVSGDRITLCFPDNCWCYHPNDLCHLNNEGSEMNFKLWDKIIVTNPDSIPSRTKNQTGIIDEIHEGSSSPYRIKMDDDGYTWRVRSSEISKYEEDQEKKFEVGDKVRVTQDPDDMFDGIIIDIDEDQSYPYKIQYVIDGAEDFVWLEEEDFELRTEHTEPLPEFKVGDKVKLKPNVDEDVDGKIGTITHFYQDGDIEIFFGEEEDDQGYIFRKSDLIKINTTPSTQTTEIQPAEEGQFNLSL